MAEVAKTIGTNARDYATHTLWEADDGGGDGLGNDDCTGSAYNDSAFDEAWLINFSAKSIVQTVAAGERHDGTAGTGARVDGSGVKIQLNGYTSAIDITIEWLEIANSTQDDPVEVFDYDITAHLQRLIVHGMSVFRSSVISAIRLVGSRNNYSDVSDCLVYGIENTYTLNAEINGVWAPDCTTKTKILNSTVHDVSSLGNTQVHGVSTCDDTDHTVQNTIATDTSGTGAKDYKQDAPGFAVYDHNLASDTTASGAGSLDSKASADQFVSTSPVNLHLKAGADAIDAGVDLGTTPTGVNYDIDNRDRDAEGDTWDMGADEYVAVGVTDRKEYIIGGGILA